MPFTALLFVVGCSMGIGKAAVFKHIPEYFPNDVGAVGGLVELWSSRWLLITTTICID